MEFTIKGGVEIRPNGYQGVKVILDCELKDVLDQVKDKDIYECLDKEAVAEYFGLTEKTE